MIVWKIAARNISERRFRSFGTILLVAFAVFVITAGIWLKTGLQNGIDSISARLGADVMIVPASAENEFEGALLSGSPSTFYMSKTVAEELPKITGVKQSASQLFISTFDSVHCAALVQIVGYDPETDFVVKPWLFDSDISSPGFGQLVAGANIKRKPGEKMLLFSKEYEVVANLEKTGMGFDNCVFVTLQTAQVLLEEYRTFHSASPLPAGKTANDVVSAVLFDVEDNCDIMDLQHEVNELFRKDGVKTVTNRALISTTSKNLGLVNGILNAISAGIWIFAVSSLAVIGALSLNERKREFGILRAVGAKNAQIASLMLAEGLILSSAGAIMGALFAFLGFFLYDGLMESSLSSAYLPPAGLSAFGIAFFCALSGIAAGLVAALFSAARVSGREAFDNMREGL
jgi:putative ABC transport system permease protein